MTARPRPTCTEWPAGASPQANMEVMGPPGCGHRRPVEKEGQLDARRGRNPYDHAIPPSVLAIVGRYDCKRTISADSKRQPRDNEEARPSAQRSGGGGT